MSAVANGRVAAFFDIDGTLVPKPSLERRFLKFLLWRRELGVTNILRWMVEAIRLAPRGGSFLRHANKMYLGGMSTRLDGDGGLRFVLPAFFPHAIERATRHAAAGHDVVLISGTLAPLAKMLGLALEAFMSRLGCQVSVRVCATRLEESGGLWTGRVLGRPMVGKSKAQAALRLADEFGYDLARSHAYADSASDRWLLEIVGHPAAVNPTWRLARIARVKGWRILRWSAAPRGNAELQANTGLAGMTVPRNFGKAL